MSFSLLEELQPLLVWWHCYGLTMERCFPGCVAGKLGQVLFGWLKTTLSSLLRFTLSQVILVHSFSGTSVQCLHFHLLALSTKSTVLSSHCCDISGSHVLRCLHLIHLCFPVCLPTASQGAKSILWCRKLQPSHTPELSLPEQRTFNIRWTCQYSQHYHMSAPHRWPELGE